MGKLEKYSSYKDSGIEWLGEIPEHWEVQKIKFVMNKIQTGTTPSTNNKNFFDGDLNWFNPKDLNQEILIESENKLSQLALDRREIKLFPKNSILIVGIGATTGKTSYLNINGTFNQQITGFHSTIHHNKFLFYVLRNFSKIFLNVASYTTLPILNNEFFKSFSIVLPPKEEQIKITSFLDKKTTQIDEVISQKEKLIELLKERKQIVINDSVTKGLDKEVEFVDSGVEWIGKIPKLWKISKLGTSLKPISIKNRADLPLLSVTREQGVILRDVDDKESNHNFIPDDLSGYKMVEKGQFAMNKMKAWQGSYGISDYTGIVSPAYFIFELNGIESTFFHKAIRSSVYVPFFIKASDGVRIGQWDLSKSRMKEIPFYIPPKDEQLQIVEYIENQTSKIDKAIEFQQNYISKLKEYKASLIDSVVTGKVRVL